MSSRRYILATVIPAALLALSGCAAPSFRADVARFQAMPPPAGQSFYVQALDARKRGGIEFSQYAAMVAQELQQRGYQPAAAPASATFIVNLDYGIDNGQQKVYSTPGWGYGGYGYGGFGGGFGGWGSPFYGRYGGRSAYFYGWNDPFFFGGGPDVESYTFYTSHADVQITRAGDGQRLFEGRAKARSTDDSLPHLVPNLIQALFTGFPGQSGEEVRITIPPPDRVAKIGPKIEPKR